MNGQQANLVVAASNWVGFFLYLWLVGDRLLDLGVCLAFLAALASTLYHSIETKHGQPSVPGVSPEQVVKALYLDRIFAMLAALYCLYHFHSSMVLWALLGGWCLALSELMTPDGAFDFYAFWHSAWHCCAFVVLSKTALNKET